MLQMFVLPMLQMFVLMNTEINSRQHEQQNMQKA